jgi:hypothetical protein
LCTVNTPGLLTDEAVVLGGLRVLEDVGERLEVGRAQQVRDVDHGLLGQQREGLRLDLKVLLAVDLRLRGRVAVCASARSCNVKSSGDCTSNVDTWSLVSFLNGVLVALESWKSSS